MAQLKTYRGSAQMGMIKEMRGDSYDLNTKTDGMEKSMPGEKRGECHPGRSPLDSKEVAIP